MKHSLLATRLYNTPLLLEPRKAAVIERVFRGHQITESGALLDGPTKPVAMEDDEPAHRGPERTESAALGRLVRRPEKQYDMTETGIAVIPVVGTLVQRTGGMQPFSGLVPYAYIGRKLDAALADPEVKAVLLEFDTYGGEVNGLFELAERIVKARAVKPVWAHVNEAAYSAGYALACAASKVYLPSTAGCCNIGVIALHIDQSRLDARIGVAYTYIYAGARKADGNPHEPLSDRARADIQAEIDRLYDIFTVHVANARDIDVERVIATEAASLNPDEAVAGEFADGIKTFAETIDALEAAIGVRKAEILYSGARVAADRSPAAQPIVEEHTMTEKVKQPAASASAAGANELIHTAAQVEAARTEGHAAGLSLGRTEGAQAERARVKAILTHDEAKDRGAVAQSLALETDMSVEQAAKVLAATPKASPGNALASVMAGISNPKVGADTPGNTDDEDAVARRIAGVKPAQSPAPH